MARPIGGRRCVPLLVVVLLLAAADARAAAGDAPSVTPYRPTVSNPADLPAPGWLEGEFGALRTLAADGSRGDSVPWLLKYAFDEDHGLLFGGNAYVDARDPGSPARRGFGDAFVEWKQRFAVADTAAFGIEAGVLAPTARDGLGAGGKQWLVNGIFSADLAAVHLDLNAGAQVGGDPPPHVSRWQTTWASAASTAVTDRIGVAFEVSGVHQGGIPTQTQALLALSYSVSNRLSLDAGGALGLTHAAHDRSLFAGGTVLIGRLRERSTAD